MTLSVDRHFRGEAAGPQLSTPIKKAGRSLLFLFRPVVIIDVVVFLGFQVFDAAVDILQQQVLIPGEGGCQADVVGHVVAAEDHMLRFRKIQVFHDDLQLFHEAVRRERCEFAPFELVLQFTAPVQHEGQGGEVVRFDFVDGMGGGQGMSFTARYAGNAENNHDGQVHACGPDAFAHFDGLLPIHALADVLQGLGVAAFHAVVQKLQSRFPELLQLIHRFPEDVSRRGVGGNLFQVREIFLQGVKNLQQPFGRKHQGIPVGQEDLAHAVPVHGVGDGDLPHDLFIRELFKFHAPVHVAVGTAVVGAAPGHPEDEAVRFTGGTENGGIIIIKK